jgi:hypothetical protein
MRLSLTRPSLLLLGIALPHGAIAQLRPSPGPSSSGVSVAVHVVGDLPHGQFSNGHDYGFGVSFGMEYETPRVAALEAALGAHRFDGPSSSGLGLYYLSGGLRLYLASGGIRPFIRGGPGIYSHNFDFLDAGLSGGAGLQFAHRASPRIEVGYTFTTVLTSGVHTTFSSLQAGARLRL